MGRGIRRHKRRQKQAPAGETGEQKYHSRPGQGYKDIVRENQLFEDFYRAQNVCEDEAELQKMLAAFKRDLPASFRITGFRSQAVAVRDLIESKYFKELAEVNLEDTRTNDDEEPLPQVQPRCLEWYPDRMAWQLNLTRKAIRRVEAYFKLHNFLVSETESGNISRQETVSMIPPRVLGVEPHHKVLDMCAAPGSKTVQLIEALHKEEGVIPEGVVVANDADNARCYMLVHQTKRLQSPCVVIMNHDASILPKIQLAPGETLKYDRVLCDVPCSGDGTLRKNADIWPKWNPANSCNLHGIQYRIAKRGLELLAVGGDMVYSTCSLNPVEDEAVLSRLLRESGDSVELVDVSSRVPGLIYKKGLSTWKVADKTNQLFSRMEDVPDHLKSLIRPCMFPLESEEEMAKLNLDRCLRILPHQQDTGGFFVAMLRKKSLCPWESVKKQTVETNNGDSQKRKNNEPGGNPAKKSRYQGFKEDPFMYFGESEAALFSEVKEYFQLQVLDRDMFLTRCADTSKRSNLYFTSPLVRCIVNGNADKIKIINTGVKAFAKAENKGAPIPYRLAQEGSAMTIPFMGKRLIYPSKADMITLLLINDSEKPTSHEDLENETRSQVEPLGTGSVGLVYEEKDAENGESKLRLAFVGWKGANSLRAYVPKNERIHYLRLLGGDTSKFEKNKFEERREKEKSSPKEEIPSTEENDNSSELSAPKEELREKEDNPIEAREKEDNPIESQT